MRIGLPYGRGQIDFEVPEENLLGILKPRDRPGASDPIAEVERALREPIRSRRLSEVAKPGAKVAIVVDDVTRPAPTWHILPPLLRELDEAGVREEDVVIIVACGTHRKASEEEARRLVGDEVARRFEVVSHDCDSPDLVYVGRTSFGTEVYLNRDFVEADVRILTGDVELHTYAGYGGGRKSVLPGVAGRRTIEQNHALLLHPRARAGILRGNPVNEDMVEASHLVRVDFALNVVLNSRRQIVRAFAGDLDAVFEEGVRLVDEMYKVRISRRADLVIASAGGYPTDLNLVQSIKAVVFASEAVKPGGTLILASECSEGYGSKTFLEWMAKFRTLEEVEEEIKKRFVLGANTAYLLRRALKRIRIVLVSELDGSEVRRVFGMEAAEDADQALEMAFERLSSEASIWVMPYASRTLPVLEEAEG